MQVAIVSARACLLKKTDTVDLWNHGMIHEELVLHTVHSGNFRIAWYFTIVQSDLRVTAKHMAEAVKLPTLLSNEVVRSNSVMDSLVEDKDDDYKSHIHVLFCRWLIVLLHMTIIRSGYVWRNSNLHPGLPDLPDLVSCSHDPRLEALNTMIVEDIQLSSKVPLNSNWMNSCSMTVCIRNTDGHRNTSAVHFQRFRSIIIASSAV